MDDFRSRFRGYSSPRPVPPRRPAAMPARPAATPAPRVEERPEPVTPREQPVARRAAGFSPPQGKQRKKRGKKKLVFIITLVLLLVGGGSASAFWVLNKRSASGDGYSLGGKSRTIDVPADEALKQQAQTGGTIRLVATGDMIAHDSINQNAKQPDGSYNYELLMDDMKPFFESADIRFCNQATPSGGESFGITGYPVFNAPVAFARGIEGVGCNVINTGTNHTNDKGQGLIDATAAAWDNRGDKILAVAGANRSAEEQNKQHIFTVKGMKFAFLTYTTYTNNKQVTPFGINMYSDALATAQITEARKSADFVIVSMRWGTEYSPAINAEQDKIAQKLTDLGADAILGHGPHVLQPVKKLKAPDGSETVVWYSLGNFLNSQLDIESLIGGFAVMDIDTATKKITAVSFMPVYQHYEWTADQKKRANNTDLLARHNFKMVPLDGAAELLAKSQNNTTVAAQTDRVKTLLNQFTPVPIITAAEYQKGPAKP